MRQWQGIGREGDGRPMRLYNTATRTVEDLIVRDNTVSMYVCGVTPYDTTHTGHAFTYVTFDTLARHLAHKGHEVHYVQNVTDIDDDVLRRAAEVGVPWDVLGREQTTIYLRDMAALNVTTPELYVRATGEIPMMIKMARALLERGEAYERNGSVYYRVACDPQFGRRLTDLDYAQMLTTANERGNYPDDPNKEDPLDFVLWQAARPGEPTWESPWGPGRPGWHIECSAMAIKYLGPQIDSHGNGWCRTGPRRGAAPRAVLQRTGRGPVDARRHRSVSRGRRRHPRPGSCRPRRRSGAGRVARDGRRAGPVAGDQSPHALNASCLPVG